MKFLVWAQEQLETKADFPKMVDLVEAKPVRMEKEETVVEGTAVVATGVAVPGSGLVGMPMELEPFPML